MKEAEIRDKEILELLSNIEKALQAEQATLRAK
jgi:ribosomal protein L29